MNRREFVSGLGAFAAAGVGNRLFAEPAEDALDVWQRETDLVKAETFEAYLKDGDTHGFASLGKLERAFERIFREARETTVGDTPAVWSVYNMGYIVKTRESLFSIDLMHRRGEEFAPLLDFALITHNHRDHYTERFKRLMDRGLHKTVVNNFFDNYGATPRETKGGYTRSAKEFTFKDVKVLTGLTDHNDYLVDYTTTFEIHVGNFTIFHTGDCSNWKKLNPRRQPDLWMVHPYCGTDPVVAARERLHPRKTLVVHLHELHHPNGNARWDFRVGQEESKRLVDAGYDADFPLWGARIV